MKRRKADWIGYALRTKLLVKLVTEGKIEGRTEVTGRRGRRRNKLPKEDESYWKLKEEGLERILRKTRFSRGYKPVSIQTTG